MTVSEVNGTSDAELEVWTKDGVKFGKELREKEFLFDEGFLNLNHGTFFQRVSSPSSYYPLYSIHTSKIGDTQPYSPYYTLLR